MAPIVVGDAFPEGTLAWFDENGQMRQLSLHSLAASKKVPSPQSAGAVNDPFVMKAWAKTFTENKHLRFLASWLWHLHSGSCLELDLSDKGLGTRSRRFALLADDLVVKVANVEGGEFTISRGADEILMALW